MARITSRHEFKLAMKEDRSEGIDGHNPSDNEVRIKRKILSQYGVSQLSDLPINFDGIRMQADEEYGNMVWDKQQQKRFRGSKKIVSIWRARQPLYFFTEFKYGVNRKR